MKNLCLLTIAFLACGLSVKASTHEETNRPVSKVVAIIKDMLVTLEKEAGEDQEMYNKLVCWCETYDKEKKASVAKAESDILALRTFVEEAHGKIAQLTAEIKNLGKEKSANIDALNKATTMRRQELADFNAEEKDSLNAISAMKAAVTVLKKHHGGASLLQTETHMSTVVNAIHIVESHAKNMYMPLEHKKILNAFLQEHGSKGFFDVTPTFKETYAPQSGQIFGILQQMQETFESNLSESQKAEAAAQAAFEDLKAAKEEEIKAGSDLIASKTDELADIKQRFEESETTMADTKAQLAEDEKFLAMLKDKCSQSDKEMDNRQKARAAEIEACTKALAILNSDDANDNFRDTFSFLQTSKTARMEAAAVLRAVHSPKLAAIALKVKLDAFVKVKQAIDDMVADLDKQQKDEVTQKDWCVSELNTNKNARTTTERDIVDAKAAIDQLSQDIDTAAKNIADAKDQIAETTTMMTRAGQDRQAENKEFQITVDDQEGALALLNKALDVMKAVYAKSLIQQAPPAGFKEYKANKDGGGVVQMLKDIIYDAEAMMAKAKEDDARSQAEYETLVKESNVNLDENVETIDSQKEIKAGHEKSKVDTEELENSKTKSLEMLNGENTDLHSSCDYILKNFDTRQEMRRNEMDALKNAKSILSGAK